VAIVYSTSEIHPRDRLAYWVEVVTKTYVRHKFGTSAGRSFTGMLRAGTVGALGVATMDCGMSDVVRTARDIACDGSDDLIVCLQLAGRAIWDQSGRQAVCDKGGFVFMDTGRPFSVHAPASTRAVTLAIPRRALEARLGPVAPLTARTMEPGGPVAGLISGFLTMLPACIDALDAGAARKLAEQTLDLLALAVSDETHRRVPALSSTRSIALLRLKSAIEARLCDAELKSAQAAEAAGIGVR
jgi:hypothetical protein